MYKTQWTTTTLASTLLVWLMAPYGAQATLTITDVGRYDFTDTSGSGARELSGIAYAGGFTASYYAVGDQDALLHRLSISTDYLTGQIISALIINPSPITLSSSCAGDREAIALQGTNILIANELGPSLETYDFTGLLNGSPITTTMPGLGVYANSQPNRAWESLAIYHTNTSTMLTANEDALTVDGPAASFTAGAMVRIQSASVDASNSTATAIGQFAYPIDAINGDNPLVSGEQSGLVELLTLPSGDVLAMERAVGLTGYRIRLYQINGESATDISGLPGLNGLTPDVDYTPLGKSLLWENTFSVLTNSNFEGIALGPTLIDGMSSLVLVADNASGPSLPIIGQQWTAEDQSLYALTIGPDSPGGDGFLTADINLDGFVGVDDLNLILIRWNQIVFPGIGPDLNTDGFIGVDDLNVVLLNWNAGTPPQASLIPEPGSACVWLGTSLCALTRIRRRTVKHAASVHS